MKTVLITGASKGIGKQLALDLALAGFTVAANYNTSEKQARELEKQHENIHIYRCDMSDCQEVEGMYAEIIKDFGAIDVVVNNAGVAYYGLLQDMQESDISKVLSVNLSGTIYSCKEAAKAMVKNHSGVIVNISSIWGINGASCEAVYSAAKGGIIAFTKALAQELAPSGIRVNSVCPGVIKTDMINSFSAEDLQALKNNTPLGRIGMATDISKAVQFLIGDGGEFITGQNLTVDGGFSL